MFRMIGAIVAGVSSALVTGSHCFTSPYHFGVFVGFLFIGMILGSIADHIIFGD